jgi:alpha-ribazole phosphatase
MTRVWLIRHGEPAEEARNRCYGSLDVVLSEKGRKEFAQVAGHLKSEPITAIYTSPRARAKESAAILAAAGFAPVEVIEDFREIAFGDFEGMTYDEIAARYPQIYQQWMERPTEVCFPGGESFPEMRTRVLRAFGSILQDHAEETIAIVSHGGVNRIVLADALQIPDHCLFRVEQGYAAMNLLAFTNGLPVVQKMNLHAE